MQNEELEKRSWSSEIRRNGREWLTGLGGNVHKIENIEDVMNHHFLSDLNQLICRVIIEWE